MTIKERIEKLDRKMSVNTKTKEKKTCFSSTTQSGIKYAIAWAAYVLIGSWVFLVLEKTTIENKVEHDKWTKFKELLAVGNVVDELHMLRAQLLQICPHQHRFNTSFDELLSSSGSDITTGNLILQDRQVQHWIEETQAACETSLMIVEEVISHPEWSFVDAIYYTMTLVTTIGFGHIYPTTDIGKVFSVVYAMAGVPLTCIFIAKNSDMLSNKMLHLYESSKKRSGRQQKTILYGVTWIFLILGCFVFMFLPSLAFATVEKWSYIDSFYFTFITLSTIGFGDYIAGYNGKPDNSVYSDTYKILIVMWIMVALGYWILLLNFLQKAIKSNAKSLKKKFKVKNISKQAEFLRQLMAKVKQQQSEDASTDNEQRLHMMAMMVEALTNSSSANRKSSGSLYNIKPSLSRLSSVGTKSISEEDSTIQIDVDDLSETSESSKSAAKLSPIKFKDLMKINVALKIETLPAIESLVSEHKLSVGDFMKIGQQRENENFRSTSPQKLSDEITLPLRDVVGVILLVASMEENQIDVDEDDDEEEGSSSEESNPVPIVDPKESIPLLRSIFLNQDHQDGIRDHKSSMSVQEKESIKNAYFESALNHYLEECEEVTDKEFDLSDEEILRRKNNMIV